MGAGCNHCIGRPKVLRHSRAGCRYPQMLYAQVVKTRRRRRLIRMRHRVVFGTLDAVEQRLAVCGWQINTAFIEVRPVERKRTAVLG